MVLNTFVHAEGLEGGSFFDTSAPLISPKMREYKGEPSDLTVQKIPPSLVDNAIGKVARFRRVSDSKESSNGLVPVARSNPRSHASVSPHSLNNTHVKFLSRLFPWTCITPFCSAPILPPALLQTPRFSHTLSSLGPKSRAVGQLFLHTVEVVLGVSFNTQSQVTDIPGISSRNALSVYFGCSTSSLSRSSY